MIVTQGYGSGLVVTQGYGVAESPSPPLPVPTTGGGGRTGFAILPKSFTQESPRPQEAPMDGNTRYDIEIAAALLLLDW